MSSSAEFGSTVWFVTGSSRGLGREVVCVALEAGHRVIATARKPEQLNDLVTKYGERVLPLAMDVSDFDAVSKAIATGQQKFGHRRRCQQRRLCRHVCDRGHHNGELPCPSGR